MRSLAFQLLSLCLCHTTNDACAAFFALLLNQQRERMLRKGSSILIVKHFAKFGLTIHVGNWVAGMESKTEALFVHGPNSELCQM